MKAQHIVEAALFSAGRPLSVQEIMDDTELSRTQVDKAMKALAKEYQGRDTVLEIGKAGGKWAMQVKSLASEKAAKFAQMEIPQKTLKTLALIAYHQPIKQSELCDMIGSKVYDHIPELKERGLVKTRRDGQTKIISTTQAFPEYFGLDAQTPDQIRMTMAKLVGIDPTKDKPRGLETFDPVQVPPPAVESPPSSENQPETADAHADESEALEATQTA